LITDKEYEDYARNKAKRIPTHEIGDHIISKGPLLLQNIHSSWILKPVNARPHFLHNKIAFIFYSASE